MSMGLAGMILGAFFLGLVTIVVVVILWRGMEVARTQMLGKHEQTYRRIAEDAVQFEQKAADEQAKTNLALEEIRGRLTAIEKLLREVG